MVDCSSFSFLNGGPVEKIFIHFWFSLDPDVKLTLKLKLKLKLNETETKTETRKLGLDNSRPTP